MSIKVYSQLRSFLYASIKQFKISNFNIVSSESVNFKRLKASDIHALDIASLVDIVKYPISNKSFGERFALKKIIIEIN